MKIRTVLYCHGSKESNMDRFEDLCNDHGINPTDEALSNAAYALLEVCIEVEFDTETGDCEVLGLSNQ